jgi:rRNA-processing protein FCF1
MCIIVDANCIHELAAPTNDGKPILKWLLTGKGGLIVGGLLKDELDRGGLRATLAELNRAGKLHTLDDSKLSEVSGRLKKDGRCRSNDPHVIAVAIVSGCRLIFTKDKKLHKDVKNRKILNPTASIYKSRKHHHLLEPCNCV